jgi:hypothetical protein
MEEQDMKDNRQPENNDALEPLDTIPGTRDRKPLDPTSAAAPPPPDIVVEN